MGWRDYFRKPSNTGSQTPPAPPEQRAMSPTVSAYVYSPGTGTSVPGLYRRGGIPFAQAASEGYSKNVIAYTAVDEVAKAVSAPPWLCYQRTSLTKGRASLEREEVPIPAVFTRPNPYQSWPEFLYACTSYHRIAGEVPIEALTPGGSVTAPPTQLYVHQPDTIRPIPGPLGLSAYGLVTSSGIIPKWPIDPVSGACNLRLIKTFNPLDPWRGLSPIAAAALSIDVHNDANTWNANLLRRGASTDIAIVAEQTMSDTSYTRLRDQLEQDASGARNVKGFTLIDGLGDTYHFEKISFSPRDMSWIEAMNTSGHHVAIAVGGSTMPFLLGLPGTTTYSNQKEARLAFHDTFVLPLLLMVFRDELNAWLLPRYGEGLELDVDLDDVPALEPRREAKWDRLEKSTFLSLNEKREALGYDPVTEPGADVPVALLPYTLGAMAQIEGEEQDHTQEAAAQRFERDLVQSGLDATLAHELRVATFAQGPYANGTTHT